MKKHLLILAGLTIVFGAQAGTDAPAAASTAASGVQSPQQRSAKFAACRKDALDKHLSGESLKEAVNACTR